MPLDAAAIGRGCGGEDHAGQPALRPRARPVPAGAGRRRAGHGRLHPGSPAVSGSRGEFRRRPQLTFVNIRETGGWSKDAAAAGPKTAALIAAAGEDMPPISLVTLESERRRADLWPRRDRDRGRPASRRPSRHHRALTKPGDVTPPRGPTSSRCCKGTIRTASGHLGAFELTIDDYALPSPSSRASAGVRGVARRRDLDLRPRPRSLRRRAAVPRARICAPAICAPIRAIRAAVERAIAEARDLVGTFDKPRFIHFDAIALRPFALRHHRLHALPRSVPDRRDHAERQSRRDRRQYLRRLRLTARRPARPARRRYALPGADALMRRLRTLLQTYRKAGGGDAVVLFHDGEHGEAVIDALARFGARPAGERAAGPRQRSDAARTGERSPRSLPMAAAASRVLTRAKPRHDIAALAPRRSRCRTRSSRRSASAPGLVRDPSRPTIPTRLRVVLDASPAGVATQKPAGFVPRGAKRGVLRNHVSRTASRRARAGRCRAAASRARRSAA